MTSYGGAMRALNSFAAYRSPWSGATSGGSSAFTIARSLPCPCAKPSKRSIGGSANIKKDTSPRSPTSPVSPRKSGAGPGAEPPVRGENEEAGGAGGLPRDGARGHPVRRHLSRQLTGDRLGRRVPRDDAESHLPRRRSLDQEGTLTSS